MGTPHADTEAAQRPALGALAGSQFDGHTPGPWKMSYDQGSYRDIMTQDAVVCTVRQGYVTRDAYHANARLVEAAPTLLATARKLADENEMLRAANSDVKRIALERNRLEAALNSLLRRHEEEVAGGEPITGEEWEIAGYALPLANTTLSVQPRNKDAK